MGLGAFFSGNSNGKSMSSSAPPDAMTPLVIVSDPGQDLDDEMTFVLLRSLVELGIVCNNKVRLRGNIGYHVSNH